MLDSHQRRLEIGSHSDRLATVRELGEMHTPEAYQLLLFAAEDVDPQIRETAQRLMSESCWHTGSFRGRASDDPPEDPDGQVSLF